MSASFMEASRRWATSPVLYGLGFVTTTALLHDLGIGLGLLFQHSTRAMCPPWRGCDRSNRVFLCSRV